MPLVSVLVLAVGLAMDAMAAAAATGCAAPRVRTRDVAAVALLFGGAQAVMPLIGYGLGVGFGRMVAEWDHWIAFALLGGMGLKMLLEAARGHSREDEGRDAQADPLAPRVLVLLAIGTSIDALAAGVTLPTLGAPPLLSVLTIGAVTAVLSGVGLASGRALGQRAGPKLDAVGGLCLVLLGAKVLIDHTTS